MWAIVLVVRLALLALQASMNLSTNTDTVADLDGRHLRSDLDGLTNNFVSYADRKVHITPATSDSVNVGTTYTATFNLDIDIVLAEAFRLEL